MVHMSQLHKSITKVEVFPCLYMIHWLVKRANTHDKEMVLHMRRLIGSYKLSTNYDIYKISFPYILLIKKLVEKFTEKKNLIEVI